MGLGVSSQPVSIAIAEHTRHGLNASQWFLFLAACYLLPVTLMPSCFLFLFFYLASSVIEAALLPSGFFILQRTFVSHVMENGWQGWGDSSKASMRWYFALSGFKVEPAQEMHSHPVPSHKGHEHAHWWLLMRIYCYARCSRPFHLARKLNPRFGVDNVGGVTPLELRLH